MALSVFTDQEKQWAEQIREIALHNRYSSDMCREVLQDILSTGQYSTERIAKETRINEQSIRNFVEGKTKNFQFSKFQKLLRLHVHLFHKSIARTIN